jgi:hypothetical protein
MTQITDTRIITEKKNAARNFLIMYLSRIFISKQLAFSGVLRASGWRRGKKFGYELELNRR